MNRYTLTRITYYAMSAGSPGTIVTVRLPGATTIAEARAEWEHEQAVAGGARVLYDHGRTDMEDDCGVDGSAMSEEELQEAAGYEFISELAAGAWRLVAHQGGPGAGHAV